MTDVLTTIEADVWDPRRTRWSKGLAPLTWRLTFGPSDDATTYTLRLYPMDDTVLRPVQKMHEDDGVWSIRLQRGSAGGDSVIADRIEGLGNAIREAQEWMMKHPGPNQAEWVYNRLRPVGYG